MVVWEIDYDFRKDKCFRRPMHKECFAPVVFDEGKYICWNRIWWSGFWIGRIPKLRSLNVCAAGKWRNTL